MIEGEETLTQAIDPGFSTAMVKPSERADGWRHALGRISDVQALDVVDQRTFAASVASVKLPSGTVLTSMRAGCSTLAHSFKIPNDETNAIVAMAYFSGRGVATQRGRSLPVGAGDIVLRQAGVHTRLQIYAPVWSLAVNIPRSRLSALDIGLLGDFFEPFKIARHLAISAPLEGMLRGLAHRFTEISPGQIGELEEAILLALGVAARRGHVDEPVPESERRNKRWKAFVSAVDRHLCDPNLGISMIAAEVGCSVRWLQKILAAQGLRFESYVLTQRLDRAERLLGQARALSITDICFDLGFNDLSHFSRSFRRRFGMSPSAYRRPT